VLFHSPPGVLFTIPSRYYPLSVTRKYLALPGGPGRFTRNSTSSVLLGHTHTAIMLMLRLRDSHPLRSCFPPGSTTHTPPQTSHAEPHHARPPTPPQPPQHSWHCKGLGPPGFACHFHRNHCYFLFPRVLRCFTSPRSPPAPYTFRHGSP